MKKIITLLSLVCSASLYAGQVFYVTEGGAGNIDGTSWANAYADVQDAIDAAYAVSTDESPSEVWIAKGTYKHGSAMTMKNNVAIYGGFAGTETTKEQRIVRQNTTYFDGEGKYRIFINDYTSDAPLYESAKLDSVTLMNGYAESGSRELSNINGGGAVFNRNSSPIFSNCCFNSNAVYSTTSSSDSPRYAGGGAVINISSSPYFLNCSFEENKLEVIGSSPRSSMYAFGGVICNINSSCMVKGGSFFANHNKTSYRDSSNFSLHAHGGVLYNYNSDVYLENVTFVQNKNETYGTSGGSRYFSVDGYAYGACVYNEKSTISIVHDTFSNNENICGGTTSYTYSSGILYNKSSSSSKIINSIFYDNASSEELATDSTSNLSITSCIIKNGFTSEYATITNLLDVDPLFGEFGYYGGYVMTLPVLNGSLAIGGGINGVDNPKIDARGVSRSSFPTIGAFECTDNLSSIKITPLNGCLYTSGSTFTLESTVIDDINCTYQWYKNGYIIEGESNKTYKGIQEDGVGSYVLRVSSPAGKIIESEPILIECKKICYYVSTDGRNANDGLTWKTAKADIQEAINLASESNYYGIKEVWVAKGTYKHGSAMTMKNNVAIYGGFAGTETNKDQRTSGNETILDGEGKYRVFYNYYSSSNPLTNSAKLDNVTIQNGYTGMENYYASPEITNCTLVENKSSSYGGGLYCNHSSPTLINCTFSKNSAETNGGGCYNTQSSNPTFINCTITENITQGSGGGMCNNSTSNPKIINTIIWGNSATTSGNDLYDKATSCVPEITNSIIESEYTGVGTLENVISADPKLMPLGNYGGSVQTCPVGAGSSAIGAGKVIESVTTDARGFERSKIVPTIGAFEYVSPTIMEYPESISGAINQNVLVSISAKSAFNDDNVSYQWQKLNENSEWIDIEGATQSTYTIENCQAEMNGNNYRCVVANVVDGASVTSEEATLTVYPSVSEATLSTNRITIVNGGFAHLEVSHNAFEPSYKWYYSSDTGLTWTEIENSNSSVLEFQASSSMSRYQYKCVVTDAGGTSVESTKAVLIINSSAITISQDIADTIAFIGKETVLSVSANSSSTLGYQWQVSADNGLTWVDIKDATSASLSFTPEDYELSGNLYRCKINNGGGFIYSSNSTITIFKNVEITSQPVDLIVWNTKNAEFAVSATGDGTVKYQWQVLAGEEWQNIDNAISSTLLLENVSTEMNGNKYRCVVSNEGTATLTSNEATLTVYKTLEITTQPKTKYTFEGDSTTFTVAVDAQGDVVYQWQELLADVWTNIENGTSATFTIPTMENSFEGRKFRVVITNGGDEFISNEVELKLATPIAIIKQPTNVAVAYIGKMATFSVEVSGFGAEYQWYVSGNYGTDIGIEIEGATSNTLSIPVEDDLILENVYFCKITNAKATLTTDMVYVEDLQTLSAFQEWSIENRLGADASPTAIPHNDGITNIEKFTFGLDASKATSYNANADFKYSTDANGNATLQFSVNADAEGVVNVKALKSTDLINWTETTATATGETSQNGKFKIYKVTAPVDDSNGKVFLKLEVEE